MTPVYTDYETFWSVDHGLSKMSPIQYVMHPDTEIISLAYAFGDDTVHVIFGEDNIRSWARSVDWSDKLLIAHNNEGFDAMISAWRFGIKPKMWGCTLAMARPIHAKQAGGSLKALAEHYGLQAKGSLEATNTKGKHLCDFTHEELNLMREYNKIDTAICRDLFKILSPLTSPAEAKLVDMTVRMLVEPQFEVATDLLTSTLKEEREKKQDMLMDLAVDLGWDHTSMGHLTGAAEFARTQLASSAKFAKFLENRGVPVPMKASPTNPEKQTYALAKTDEEFIALQEHSDPVVVAAALARLGVKSTLLETRIEAFLAASAAVGKLPIPLKYYGADTTGRDSGWAYNPQNLPRVAGKPSDCLRNSLRAPKGMKVIVADLSGIELRVNHFLWKVPSSVALFQADPEKADLYRAFAATMYGIEPGAVNKTQRQYAKACQLGLGFGAGPATFVKVAKMMGGIDLTLDESKEIVAKWRGAYYEIAQGWKTCHAALSYIAQGQRFQIDPWGLCHTSSEGIVTPKGIIRYPKLRQELKEDGKAEWVYGEGRNKARIYGPKCVENIVQHLARNVIMGNALEFKKQTGLSTALRVHDELVYVVPEDAAEEKLALMQSIMRTPPTWWPELVVWSEGGRGDTYGSCK